MGVIAVLLNKALAVQRSVRDEEMLSQALHDESDSRNRESLRRQLAEVRRTRVADVMTIVANLGDLVVAMNACKVISVNDGTLGVCGLISALIGGFYRWKAIIH